MGRIQSSVGLISGLNIQDTVNKLMQLNAIPRDRLAANNQQLRNQQVAYTELTALVIGVQLTSDRLGQASLYTNTKVTSSKTDVLTARSTGDPKPGSYSFTSVRLAQAQQLTSTQFANEEQLVGEGSLTIQTGGFLDDSQNLDLLNGGQGVQRGKIKITDRSGESAVIDLRFAQTAQDVIDAINSDDSIDVTASLNAGRFQLTDTSGETASNLIVEEVNGQTAEDLGLGAISVAANTANGQSISYLSRQTSLNSLLDGRGLEFGTDETLLQFSLRDGTSLDFSSKLKPHQANLGQLLDELNAVGDDKFTASISDDGLSLQFQDLTEGDKPLSISSPNGSLAAQLGWEVTEDNWSTTRTSHGPYEPGKAMHGRRLLSGLGDVLLNSLSGGKGIESLGEITIKDRSGASETIDLSSAQTVDEVVNLLNDSSLGIQASLNKTKTGISITDTTGQTVNNLVIEDVDNTDTATRLGLAQSVSGSTIDGGSLKRQFVSSNTLLSEYNRSTEFAAGRIRIINSAGEETTLNLRSKNISTVGEAIEAINKLQLDVRATINADGDGITVIDEAGGAANLVIEDLDGGTTAAFLGIAGQSEKLEIDGEEVSAITHSNNLSIDFDDDATIEDLVDQLNDLDGSPLRASLLRTNASGGVRLVLSSTQTGSRGRVAIDSDIDFGLVETNKAQDALLSVGGSADGGGVLLASDSNTFTNVLDEFSLTLTSSSETAVTVSISQNDDSLSNQVKAFVEQYNKVVDKVNSLTNYDATANTVGLLFGSTTVLRVQASYSQLITGRLTGTGSISSLAQLGVQFNDTGKLEFDSTKLQNAIDNDRQAVEDFFRTKTSGFAARAKGIADNLAETGKGALLRKSTSIQEKIDVNAKRVTLMEGRLDKQRERLLKQFNAMESALAKSQSNLNSLNSLQVITATTGT